MGPQDGRAQHPYDQARAERAVKELLLALGEDPDRDGLRETPARVARALSENFAGLWQSPEDVLTTTFDIGRYRCFLALRAPPHSFSWRRTRRVYPLGTDYWSIENRSPS